MKRNGAFFLIPALLLTLASCAPASGGVSVTASKVRSESPLSDASYSAALKAVQEVTVTPKVSATITAVNFQVGDAVQQGDVILTLDSAEVENQYRQAEAACDIAKINLENAGNGNAASTRLKLQQAVDAAQIGVDSATIAYNTAKSSCDKVTYLESIGEASSFDIQQAENALAGAQCALDSATQALRAAQDTQRISESTLIPESIAAAEKQLESAQAALNTAQSYLDDTQLTAPIAGVISQLEATAGEMANAQSVQVTVIDPSAMDLEIGVTAANVVKLQSGLPVRVTVDDIAAECTGTITTIAPSANADTGLYAVTVRIDNSDGALRAGMPARVSFDSGENAPALYIPQQSVVEENGIAYVYKVNGNAAEKTEVTLGAQKNLYVKVESGLTAEDTVIVDGAGKVSDGGAVHVIKTID